MKKVFYLVLLALIFYSCGIVDQHEVNGIKHRNYTTYTYNYTTYTVAVMNELNPPIVLIGKSSSLGSYGITLKDGNDSIVTFGNMSTLANNIGDGYNVGDTIVYSKSE